MGAKCLAIDRYTGSADRPGQGLGQLASRRLCSAAAHRSRRALATQALLLRKLRTALAELVFEACDDARVHLAHAAFRKAERIADLLHRQFFIIVEDNDQPLVAVEPLRHQLHQIALLDAVGGVDPLVVLENVDLANVLVAVGLVPLLVEADEVDGAGFGLEALELLGRDLHLLGDLAVGGRPAQFSFRLLAGRFHLAGLAADEARYPVHRAQLVEHRPPDPWYTIRFELDSPSQIEGFDRVHQAEDACRDQVIQVYAVGELRPHTFGIVADQGQVFFDQDVAQFLAGLVFFEFLPDFADIAFELGNHLTLRGFKSGVSSQRPGVWGAEVGVGTGAVTVAGFEVVRRTLSSTTRRASSPQSQPRT